MIDTRVPPDIDASAAPRARVGTFSYDIIAGRWDCDDEVLRILGLRPGAIVAVTDHVLVCDDPADRARVTHALARAETDGEPVHVFYHLNAADGVARRVLLIGEATTSADTGFVTGIEGHLIDLTEDIRHERAEAAREAVLESVKHRAVIERAVGGLMTAYGLSADSAFEMLRWWSQDRNVKVRDLAARLTEAAAHGTATAPSIRATYDALLHRVSA